MERQQFTVSIFFTVTTFVTTIENSELLHSLDLVRGCRVNISHRQCDGGMSHQLFEAWHINPGHRRPRAKCVPQVVDTKFKFYLPADRKMATANCHRLVRIQARWKEASPLSRLRPPFKHFRSLCGERNVAPCESSLTFWNEDESGMDIFFPDGIDLIRPHPCLKNYYRNVLKELWRVVEIEPLLVMGKDSHLARSLLEKLHPDRIRFDISLCDGEVHHVPKSRQIPVDSRRTALLKPCDLESLDRRHVYLRDLSSKKFEKRFRTHPIPLMSRGFILGLRPRQELLNELAEVRGFPTRLAHDYFSLFPGLHSHRLSFIREACGSPILNAVVNELKPVNVSSLVDHFCLL